MPTLPRYILWLLVLSLPAWPMALLAQYKFDKPIVLNKEKGMPTNSVRALAKSRDGFMWLGTSEGLCRFDGLHFKTYIHEAGDSNSIFDDVINGIQPVNHEIWVTTEMGVSVLDTRTGKFRNYQLHKSGSQGPLTRNANSVAVCLYLDRDSSLWVGTRNEGLFRYIAREDRFESWSYPGLATHPGLRTPDRILSICESKTNDSVLYVGTLSGLLEINRLSRRIRMHFFKQQNSKYETDLNVFRRIYAHDDGLIYVGSWATGVHVFHPDTDSLIPLDIHGQPGDHLQGPSIQRLLRKSEQEIWITTANGLYAYNTSRHEITFRKENDIRENQFYGADFIDERYRAWLIQINGVSIFDPVLQQFVRYPRRDTSGQYWGFYFYVKEEPEKNRMMVLPRVCEGIYAFDLGSRIWQPLPFLRSGKDVPTRMITRGFGLAPDGHYTISSDQGLFQYNPQTGVISPYPWRPRDYLGQCTNLIWSRSGKLWLCTRNNGLYCYDPVSKKSLVFRSEFEVPGSAPLELVEAPFEDSRGQIWICRGDGISIVDPRTNRIYNHLFGIDSAHSVPLASGFAEDALHRLWVVGADGQIAFAETEHPEKGIVWKKDLKRSEVSGELVRIASDSKGFIWGQTVKSVFKVDPYNLTFSIFGLDYGLDDPDFYSFRILSSGELFFGGRSDVVMGRVPDLVRNNELPDPYITDISVLQRPYAEGGPPELIRSLLFSHRQNFFSISFSAKAFTLGSGVRFRYRLAGFEEKWEEAAGRHFANYTNVPPGGYTFQLQCANNEGVWNPMLLELPITIKAAWWNTLWFQMLMALLLLTALWRLYRWRIHQIRNRARMKLSFERKLANMEMSALLAQMNPHFIFNSLNSIDSYIIRKESKQASEYLNNFARLIRLILNNSRNNYISLKEELETLELYLQMESLRFQDRFSYDICVEEDIDTNAINIPPMLIQPYVENAIWHGLMHKDPQMGDRHLQIGIRNQDNRLQCVVEDNGIGRKQSGELNNRRSQARKKSMGMQITADRIEIINKLYSTETHVQVEDLYSETGEPAGTRVILSIPI